MTARPSTKRTLQAMLRFITHEEGDDETTADGGDMKQAESAAKLGCNDAHSAAAAASTVIAAPSPLMLAQTSPCSNGMPSDVRADDERSFGDSSRGPAEASLSLTMQQLHSPDELLQQAAIRPPPSLSHGRSRSIHRQGRERSRSRSRSRSSRRRSFSGAYSCSQLTFSITSAASHFLDSEDDESAARAQHMLMEQAAVKYLLRDGRQRSELGLRKRMTIDSKTLRGQSHVQCSRL